MFLGYAIFGLQVLYLKYLAVDYRVKNLSQGCSPADSTGYPQAKLWKVNNIFFYSFTTVKMVKHNRQSCINLILFPLRCQIKMVNASLYSLLAA